MEKKKTTAVNLTDEEFVYPGNRACPACGLSILYRIGLKAIGRDAILIVPPSCLTVMQGLYPIAATQLSALNVTFASTAAAASGVKAALRAQKNDHTQVVAWAGDGGTADIGLQALSGAIERGEDFLYICYDNEGYMNTGVQRSGSTPHAAATTTSPAGVARMGKRHLKKDILSIIAAHHIPYAATASVAYPADLRKKVRRGLQVDGPSFLQIHSPCPLGWAHGSELSIEVARLAVQTGLFPLIELERGALTGAMHIRQIRPVTEYLKLQGRFRHLFTDDLRAREELAHLQALADHNIEIYDLLGNSPEALDTEGADTVRRGGLHSA